MKKDNILVLFGGQSSEHEVSCMSAANVIDQIDREKHQVIPVGITMEGHWMLVNNTAEIRDGSWRNSKVSAALSPDATKKELYLFDETGMREVHIDIAFPVLHGLHGEDGTVQGLFELAGIPYVGCGVLASAACMDKCFTKLVVDTLGIRQAAYVTVHRTDLGDMKTVIGRVEAKLPYPVFVKPSCAGSSRGVGKAENAGELEKALLEAARHDGKILVEETIVGREIECAVFGTDDPEASGVGEIRAAAEFYDYDAKYNNAASETVTDPDLPEGAEEEVRTDAVRIFKALGCFGLSRVDFFLDQKGVVFNEINTMPGFTAISMYPMLWAARGVSKPQLVEKLIQTADKRREH